MDAVRIAWGEETLICHAGGLCWLRSGVVRDEPWDDVIGIATHEAARGMRLSIALRDQTWIRVVSREPGAFACAEAVRRCAVPRIAMRLEAELAAGREATFGPVGLTPTTLRVGRKSWPLASIAGHRIDRETWMLDVGPREKPSLVATVKLDELVNHEAFCMLLEQLRPGLDHRPDPVFRPSATSHDRRYLSRHSRLVIAAAIACVGLIVGGACVVQDALARRDAADRERTEEQQATATLFAELRGIAERETEPFACDAPLQSGADRGELIGALGRAATSTGLPSQLPVALQSGGSGLVVRDTVSTRRARYVVLGEVLAAAAPTAGALGSPGVARIALRVSEWPSRKIVCRGIYMAGLAPATGSSDQRTDLLWSITRTAIHPVCIAGGPALCDVVQSIVVPADPDRERPARAPVMASRHE